jgi:hypothetical protein
MPIEIKELIIKAEVSKDVETPKSLSDISRVEAGNKEAIIEECVERILDILNKIKER